MANDPQNTPFTEIEKDMYFTSEQEGVDFPWIARDLVRQQAETLGVKDIAPGFSIDDVYIVWFAFTLGNWKALCSTAVPDGRYYEVTYNASKRESYVDTYKKTHNVAVKIII